MEHGKPEDHLVLPQRNGVDDGGADLLHHEAVVVLDEPYLRRHLHGYLTRQLKVVYLLFKAADEICKVVRRLRVLGQTGFLRVLDVLGQLHIAKLLYLELAGEDIHRQLLHVLLILVVHLIHHADVLHQRDFVLFKRLDYFIHVHFGLVELRLHRGDVVRRLLEKPAQTLLFLLREVEPLKLHHKVAQHVADLAEILRAHGAPPRRNS